MSRFIMELCREHLKVILGFECIDGRKDVDKWVSETVEGTEGLFRETTEKDKKWGWGASDQVHLATIWSDDIFARHSV